MNSFTISSSMYIKAVLVIPFNCYVLFCRSLIPSQTYNEATDIELAAIENEYVDWSVADDPTDGNQIDGFIRLNTDISFSCPTEYVARALEAAGAEIYRYEMTHDPSWSVYAGI